MEREFDIIVVGGGHAGVEASYAGAKLGLRVLLLTLNRKMIANMPCNPHIGGSAKGVVVREIDALGGLMAIAADHHPLQIKMLNTGKGPGVWCLRSQQDKAGYPAYVQEVLERTKNLEIEEKEVVDLLHDEEKVFGVITKEGERILAKAVILTTGTYMNGRRISGSEVEVGGPDGDPASIGLSESLVRMGLEVFRLKTGTPPRIKKSTIDFSKASIQLGSDDKLAFSYETKTYTPLSKQLPCYLIYTNEKTHEIINVHLNESAIFNGTISGVGPRYCPAIESKLVRFPDKERHQLFLEPEFEDGESIYLQGFSTGLPHEVQEEMVHTLPGLEHCEILKWAYQIEYDALKSTQFDAALRVKRYQGLYGAGQICGTSGYEEAGALGLIAGINAARAIRHESPFILKRNEAYIGVMIDDLVTKGTDEPYRLLSSRAEYRLLLRHDNADLRLCEYGYQLGMISEERYQAFKNKYARIEEAISLLEKTPIADRAGLKEYLEGLGYSYEGQGFHGLEILKRPFTHYPDIAKLMPEMAGFDFSYDDVLALETKVKYEGYIKKEEKEAQSLLRQEKLVLPENVDYLKVEGLRLEARQKLNAIQPISIGQASRIPGVNPADISILLLTLRRDGKL
ncbi:MAG: tRNA uridine-5-carboxymethylaminomethyl(34) synthesis enzyme MnmG [Bacilli bacterium]|nr:tRNA uridine-5-carboxymethylaminomethyl(34) synthesis enzyme MnmG [Bacilli bacterium]